MNINPAYYEHEFKSIEISKQARFNWAAFFGGITWMTYRKMYKYVALNFLACLGLGVILGIMAAINGVSGTNAIPALKTIFISSLLVIGIIQGMYANKWYYKTVQQKISDGYHMIDGFRSTSYFGLCFGIWWALVAYFFEKKELQAYLEKHELSEKDTGFSEKNVKKYLQSAMPQSEELKWGVIFVGSLLVFSWYSSFNTFSMAAYMGLARNDIKSSMDKIATSVNTEENKL